MMAVHGGAGTVAQRRLRSAARRSYERALAKALRAGQSILIRGGSAVRAVTAAVVVLEDDELFNAGRGAVLCADGTIELCASVMDGWTSRTGAMVGLRRMKNPVLAAASLIRHSHGLLFGDHGDGFAAEAGLETVNPEYFVTRKRTVQWKRLRGSRRTSLDLAEHSSYGTVGAVALDRRGHLAAATSTGGLVNQLPGRVGDTPVIGAGTWADRSCAVSATGKGDVFARIAFARRVADLIELLGLEPDAAASRALAEIGRVRGRGGCIVVDAEGHLAMPFNTPQMLRGWIVGRGNPFVAIRSGESIEIEDQQS